MLINDRLSTILTQHAGEMAFVQRSHIAIIHASKPTGKIIKSIALLLFFVIALTTTVSAQAQCSSDNFSFGLQYERQSRGLRPHNLIWVGYTLKEKVLPKISTLFIAVFVGTNAGSRCISSETYCTMTLSK